MLSISHSTSSRLLSLATLPIALLLASAQAQAQATTEDFEGVDCGSGMFLQIGTAGMSWDNGGCINGVTYGVSGYQAGVTSGSNVAFNNAGAAMTLTKTGGGNFSLLQAQMTAAWNDNLQVQIEGFNGSTSSGIQTVTLSSIAPSLVTFTKASNVDRVVFTSSGGTKNVGYTGSGTQFAMDDLRYILSLAHIITVVPSPNGTMSCTPNPVVDGGNALCTPVPDAGYSVTGFSGCTSVSSANDCELTNVTAPATVGVTFAPLTYPITVTLSANGIISCTPNPVEHGSDSTCTATAQSGYAFGSWGDDCAGTIANSCTLSNVTTAKTVSASFTLNSYAIGTTANPPEGGSVSCTPSTVAHGGSASCTATALSGYAFASWAGDCTGTAASCLLSNVTVNKAVTANFTLNSYTVTTTANPPEGGSVSCTPNPVAHGSNATCTAAPASGFAVASFSGCTRVGSTNDCELSNVTAAATVSATFTALPVITTTGNLPDATEGQAYSQSLVVTGGTAPYTWAVVDGSLPPGMTLDAATGVISGTVPKQAVQKAASNAKATGAFAFSVQVTDSSNPQLQSTLQQLSLQVVAAPVAATATPVPTMGTWALALLGLLIAGFGFQRRSTMQG